MAATVGALSIIFAIWIMDNRSRTGLLGSNDRRGQVKAARKLLGWSQQDLETLAHLEIDRKPLLKTVQAVRAALEAAGVEFPFGKPPRLKRSLPP